MRTHLAPPRQGLHLLQRPCAPGLLGRHAERQCQDDGGEAALHHTEVVPCVRRLRLVGHRQAVGNHEGGAGRQGHVLRADGVEVHHLMDGTGM